MGTPRLVLLVGASDAVPDVAAADDPAATAAVDLVVPPVAALFEGAWLDALARRRWQPLATWLDRELERHPVGGAAGETSPPPRWRVDRLVDAWVDRVGADRVRVLPSRAVPDVAAPRPLSGAEVDAVERLVVELEELDLLGRNAAELLHAAGVALRHAAPADPAGPPEALAARVAEVCVAMRAAISGTGAGVELADADLRWPGTDGDAGGLALDEAAGMSVAVLERVLRW